ncbi:MAG: xanthine dehydrogenase family protein subunit M [Acidimicrobiales bacterium]|nr:xanthine dehydrogenase family protein subunit M [Acidimicrobiales bacterium]
MKAPPFEYHRPSTLDEALDLLATLDDAKVIAGGQSLLPLMALRLSRPAHLVDIGDIGVLQSLAQEPDGSLRIGALVTHRQAETSDLVARCAPLLAAATPQIGHRAIRTRGTVCGSLAHADPAAELPAVAVACGARVTAVSTRGARDIAAAELFQGYLQSSLAPDELLTRATFPAWPEGRYGTVVEVARRGGDYAVLGLVCWIGIEDGHIADARLVYFGASDKPARSLAAEDALKGKSPGHDAFAAAGEAAAEELNPTADIHGSASYRRHLAAVLAERGLADAHRSAPIAGRSR